MKSSCRVQTLASDGLCAVDYCPGCGVFHLKVGFATLNFRPEGFAALGNTINQALARFHERRREGSGACVQEEPKGGDVFH